jgi:hypothetical protein
MIVSRYTGKMRKGGNAMLPTEQDFDVPVTYRGVIYDAEQTIGTATAAVIAGRGRRTIINWCKKGYLKSLKIGGPRGQYEIVIKDLIECLQTPGSAAPPSEDGAA